jgi:hypothetical protein
MRGKRLLHKMTHQGSFSRTGLTGHETDPPRARQGLVQASIQFGQLVPASDKNMFLHSNLLALNQRIDRLIASKKELLALQAS